MAQKRGVVIVYILSEFSKFLLVSSCNTSLFKVFVEGDFCLKTQMTSGASCSKDR